VEITGTQFFNQLNFQSLNECNLNPFKVCQTAVVHEFVRITAARGLLDCTALLKKNRKIIVAPSQLMGQNG
jgi:hypothetical protein